MNEQNAKKGGKRGRHEAEDDTEEALGVRKKMKPKRKK